MIHSPNGHPLSMACVCCVQKHGRTLLYQLELGLQLVPARTGRVSLKSVGERTGVLLRSLGGFQNE
jgi:hypothetical protein